jgi:hypothetical protein
MGHFRALFCLATLGLLLVGCGLRAQQLAPPESREKHFVAQRSAADGSSAALAYQRAREQAAALLLKPRGFSLSASWQPLGPVSILSPSYGNLTGRITALAFDPNDTSGNTLYVGTTGGGVWKSSNAAATSPSFTPLTDTLPVFGAGAGTIPSLSIGALAVQPLSNPVLLAGTGDPNSATDSYYGEGLLRSADGGLTWTLVAGSHDGANGNHSFAGLATAGLAFSSATPTQVIAAFSASPESATVAAANSFSIPGLYYSTDAGKTWQMSTIMDGSQIVQQPQPLGTGQVGNAATAVVWDPLRLKFFAALRAHGYYSSSDGVTWTRLAAQPGTNLTTANCPVGSNGLGNTGTCPIFRGALAVQPVTGDIYALTVDANSVDQGLWQDFCDATSGTCSNNAPTFANRIDNAALESGGSGTIKQGTYNLTLNAEPSSTNSTLLFAGTMDLYRCAISASSSSCNLRDTTNALSVCSAAVAPSQHALATLAAAAPLIFLGNDGGLWRSLDGAAVIGTTCSSTDASHFNNLNAALGSLAEVTGFAQHPTDANTILAGLGSNGSAATSAASMLTAWPQMSAGEGGFPALDPATPNNWYLAIGAGVDLKQCSLGSACTAANFDPPGTIGAAQIEYDADLLDAPTLLDPALATNLLTGTCRVWRGPAASSSTWSSTNAISPAFNGSLTPCTATSPLLRSLAAGGPSITSTNAQLSGSEVIYAGLAGALDGGSTIAGHLFVTKSAQLAYTKNSWTDIALSPVINDSNAFNASGFDVSSIAVDPHDATGATVYATIMGFGVPHLYRSNDFGAHWLNISDNLPDAPANAVVVDPNDANTVYIALDTGVYVTTTVSTCSTASASCWSALGTALPNAPVIALAAATNVPTGDGRLGMLRAATYGRGIWQQPLLTAVTPVQPALTLSATNFVFTSQQVSTQSAAQALTVTSSGNAPVTFGALTITGDFTETDNCARQTLPVGAMCAVQISFAPTVIGVRTGQLTLFANISGGQAVVTLNGTGTTPATITFTPAALTFPATLVHQTSAAQNLVVANTGGTTATLQTPAIVGANASDFAISANTCSSTLGASTACALSITFTPTASGSRTAQLSLTDSVGTQTAALSGTGNAPATDTLAPTSLTFAQQTIGTSSTAQSVTLTNNGDTALTLITTSVTPGDFTATNSCGTSLAAHSTCAIQVNFIPAVTGTRASTLTVTDQFRSQTVALSGTGIAPPGVSLLPTSLTFAATGVGLTSAPQAVTLTNNGGQALNIASITASPGFTIATNTCVTSLAPNAACALQIVFAPTTAGAATGYITILDNAPTPTQTVALSGSGVDFTLAATGSTTATLSISTMVSNTYTLQLTSLSTLTGTVALSCSGAPANATCNAVPSTVALGTTTPVNVTVLIETKAQLAPPFLFQKRFRETGIVLALLFPAAFFARRRIRETLLSIAMLCCIASLASCGIGRTIPNDNPIAPAYPTPPGTYNLTVSATSAGLSHTVGLTLIVQ